MSGSGAAELLLEISELLTRTGIPYMVVGSFASSAYGEPRSTHDLDLVIDPSPSQLDGLLAALSPERFYFDVDVARDALRRRSMFNVIAIETGWKLDLVIKQSRAFSIEELARRQTANILGLEISTATPEDTIIAKLEWAKAAGSDRQLDDAAGILRVQAAALDTSYIERWVTTLDLVEQWSRVRGKAGPP